ncbi:hypothetical protein BABA_04619 [Neobacillus bataviensis LMG 21833]|uniref:Uncharacterized protein n=1 Tax=Neobacillus bataviensis LMG 21833 TaxID=1117379 RepID=K6CHT0_9BACI|nr:hypothetical protein [Neobacillus bataviensis]EKN70695.1 hypothetical protein BABA_04619 [Neobacillus bataviensis LMG 21833]
MGVICPCGVLVNAVSTNNNVKFTGQTGTVKGDLTYLANVCVTTLGTSTLSLSFVDTETPGANNFTFTANAITSVTCKREGQNCVVTVDGTGLVNGVQFPFEAVFRDQVATAANDNVQSFVITGFFDQNGAAPVPQGSIIALGCQ